MVSALTGYLLSGCVKVAHGRGKIMVKGLYSGLGGNLAGVLP